MRGQNKIFLRAPRGRGGDRGDSLGEKILREFGEILRLLPEEIPTRLP